MYKDTIMKPIVLYVSPPKNEKPKLYSELNKGRQPIILQSTIGWTSNLGDDANRACFSP